MKKHISILVLISALIGFFNTGCRTMEGAGEDIERAGKEIKEEAR